MAKIENHSIFGNYTQVENRVTAALLQILKVGGTEFIGRFISEIDEIEFPSSDIIITTQEKEKNNIYDGLLECNFSFRVIVESKIYAEKINIKQLKGLVTIAQNPTDFILFITPDNTKPKALLDEALNIYWANWKKVNSILKDINTGSEPLNFLISEFEKYLDFLNLLDFVSIEERVQIAAGSWGEPIAKKYGFYACQNNRTFKPSKYLAFYNNGGIHSLFEIVKQPINNCDLSLLQNPKVHEYLSVHEPNYSGRDKRQFYELLQIDAKLAIKHTGKNKNGKKSAYTMGVFRYSTIDKIKTAKTTQEL